MPDFGHTQPLLKIADALAEDGFDIHCYLAAECAPVLQRFSFPSTFLESMDLTKAKSVLREVYSRSLFFNRFSSYAHVNIFYLPQVMEAVSRSAEMLKKRLSAQEPDVIVADAFLFGEWYGRIAEHLDVPVILNNPDGTLASDQNRFVQTFGVTKVPTAMKRMIVAAGVVHEKTCKVYYRSRYLKDGLKARSSKRDAKRAFDAVFPKPPSGSRVLGPIRIGSAAVERERLRGKLATDVADANVFRPVRFRSSLPVSGDLRRWIDAAGAKPIVYVSFGSAMELKDKFLLALYEGLSRVPARVLWSLPDSQQAVLASQPPVEAFRFESFVPQPEVLEHPAVRCFVSHGGASSVQEALFGGTPNLCIPFCADMGYNSSVVEQLGVGRRMWRSDVSAESIAAAVNDLIENPAYATRAAEISDDMRNREGGAEVARFVTSAIDVARTRTQDPVPALALV